MAQNKAVMALFSDESAVARAAERLRDNGFRASDISVLLPSSASPYSAAPVGHVKDTKAPEGATAGLTAGAVVGGTLGWLVGIGVITVTGVGALIAAGPIMAALAGVGVGGALGSITGALIGMGIPEYEAKRYEGLIKDGKALLSVHCDNAAWVSRARDILETSDGQDIATCKEEAVPTATKAKDTGKFGKNSNRKIPVTDLPTL